ncbi:MAG: heavy-metal-associated domain-containing protein [Fretibacterium sp.]|nr:heavy-metal-associated domain-containing protein [Fretibacterium sp.]
MKKALFVSDMSCQHCVGRIKKALDEAGLSGYEILPDSREVLLEESSAKKAADALASAGYPSVAR